MCEEAKPVIVDFYTINPKRTVVWLVVSALLFALPPVCYLIFMSEPTKVKPAKSEPIIDYEAPLEELSDVSNGELVDNE